MMNPFLLVFFSGTVLVSASVRPGGQRGWNTYDGWNGAANESAFLSGAAYQSSVLLPFGFDLATIDGGWYTENAVLNQSLDAYGRYYPDKDLYPSAADGNGFRSISAAVKSMGLKFGIWSIRGIPVNAVNERLPIAGSIYTADQAARMDQNCNWWGDNYGVLNSDAGKAWYASLASLYASWGVDFVKIDCMVGNGQGNSMPGNWSGLYTDDFTTFAEAFKAAGIEISVSPGSSMNVQNGSYIAENELAAHYRITQDFWDRWYSESFYPTGLKSKLDAFAAFSPLIGINGVYPDGDMLPIGDIYHNDINGTGIYGPPSPTHLSSSEQTLLMTLWCIARAPLILGARLPLDPSTEDGNFTLSLLTNAEVLAVQNGTQGNAPVPVLGSPPPVDTHAWTAVPTSSNTGAPPSSLYIALFNAGEGGAMVAVETQAGVQYCARDLWAHAALGSKYLGSFGVDLPPHSAGLYLLTAC